MTKYTFVVYHRELDEFLQHLQDLGVVDVTTRDMIPGEEEQQQMNLLNRYNAVESLLTKIAADENITHQSAAPYNVEELLEEVERLRDERQHLEGNKDKIFKDIEAVRLWGDFSIEEIKKLEKSGVHLHFYTSQHRAYNSEWEEKYNIFIVNESSSEYYFVVAQQEGEELPILDGAQEVKKLTFSTKDKEAELRDINSKIEQIDARLKELSVLRGILKPAKVKVVNKLQLKMAENTVQREADNTLAILTGFAPVEKEGDLVGFLENEGTFYFTDEVTAEDDAPVLLKNNSFAKLYEPITKLFSLPTYTELDPTPLFAPFFMMFFGFCLGDGGYGLLIMLVATLLKRKFQQFKPLLTLAQWLGFATVIFGILSGTFFGIALVDIEALKSVRKYFLDMDNMMMLSLIVGGIQIIYGMCVKAVNITRQKGFKYAISQIATVVLVLTAAAYIGLPMLKVNLAGFVSYMLLGLIILSALIYFFYNTPGKNPLMNFGTGLWNFYNLLTGLLGDLLSYIRLFALGLTGGILGGVFNTLALDVYGDKFSILGFLGMLFILLFGHGLNFMLNLLGAVVHPIRLTFVEFYKNSGFEGGGRAYNPLKREKE